MSPKNKRVAATTIAINKGLLVIQSTPSLANNPLGADGAYIKIF